MLVNKSTSMFKNANAFIKEINDKTLLCKFDYLDEDKKTCFEEWVERNNPEDNYTKQVKEYCLCFGKCGQYMRALYSLPVRKVELLIDCAMEDNGYNLEARPQAKILLKEIWRFGYEL